jgi:hypothetical protein
MIANIFLVVFFKDVVLVFNPGLTLTTHHSNIGVHLRQVYKIEPAYLWGILLLPNLWVSLWLKQDTHMMMSWSPIHM